MILVDCMSRGTTSQAEADFRNSHFQVHIAQVELYPLTGTRFEYCRPFWANDFLLHPLGLPTLPIPGGTVFDLTLLSTRNAIVTALVNRVNTLGVEGLFIDTYLQFATGQDAQAIALLTALKAALAPKILMLNAGDLLTWATTTPGTVLTIQNLIPYQFVQLAFDVDPASTLPSQTAPYNTRLALLESTLAARSAAGCHVTVGLFDANGVRAQAAYNLMLELSAYSNTSLFYATVAFSDTLPIRQFQWCEAIPEGDVDEAICATGASASTVYRAGGTKPEPQPDQP
jgi:hypothetical protein